MMDPITITLVQQEQHRDRLKKMEQDQLIRAAGLSRPGPERLLSPLTAWFGRQMIVWGLKLQPPASDPAACCIQCAPHGCTPANISA